MTTANQIFKGRYTTPTTNRLRVESNMVLMVSMGYGSSDPIKPPYDK